MPDGWKAISIDNDLAIDPSATTTGHAMYYVSVGRLALQLTDSPFFVGLAAFTAGISMLIFGPWAGVVADRVNRRTLLIAGQFGLLSSAGLYTLLIASGTIASWSILLLAFLAGTSMAFVFPARPTVCSSRWS